MIPRTAESTLNRLWKGYPIVGLNGPRQAGKTTLSRQVAASKPYVSLEDPSQLEFATTDPRAFLAKFPNGAILDEIQRAPALFSYLQTQVDLDGRMGLFLLTGSRQFELTAKLTQSLAGRIGLVHLLPFAREELLAAGRAPPTIAETIFSGGYPPVIVRDLAPNDWFSSYVATYLERDVRQVANIGDLTVFQRFLRLTAGRTGQLINYNNLAADTGISRNTAAAWLSVLETSGLIFQLPPYFSNHAKRLIRTPKLYFCDTGLACWLLGIRSAEQYETHPLRGAIFETWVISEVSKAFHHRGLRPPLFFWKDKEGNEVDLLIETSAGIIPAEIKSGATIGSDFFANLIKWRKFIGATGSPSSGWLVYGGDSGEERSHGRVASWSDLNALISAALGS
jgi:uncharacterized protein